MPKQIGLRGPSDDLLITRYYGSALHNIITLILFQYAGPLRHAIGLMSSQTKIRDVINLICSFIALAIKDVASDKTLMLQTSKLWFGNCAFRLINFCLDRLALVSAGSGDAKEME